MKPAIKAMQEWQPYPAASSGRNRRGAAGAALRFSQGSAADRSKNRLSARGNSLQEVCSPYETNY